MNSKAQAFSPTVVVPCLFRKFSIWDVGDLGQTYLPFGSMAHEVALSLATENLVFKGLFSDFDRAPLEKKLRDLAQDIYGEIETFRQWLDWETDDEGYARSDLLYPHNSNAEILLEFIDNGDASGEFIEGIQKKYGFKDTCRVIISIQLLTELDLMRSQAKDYPKMKELGLGDCMKSMGMLYGIWKVGLPKVEAEKDYSDKMKKRGKKKGAWLRSNVIEMLKKILEECPKIKSKEAYTRIAESLWNSKEIRRRAKKERFIVKGKDGKRVKNKCGKYKTKLIKTEDDFREYKVKWLVYNHRK